MDLIDRKIAPALEQMVQLVDAKLAHIRSEAVEAQGAVLREQVVTVEDLRSRVNRQVEEFEMQLRDMRQSGAQQLLKAMQSLADHQSEAYERMARQVDQSLASLERSRQAMEGEVERTREATIEVMQQLGSMVRTLGEEMAGTKPWR